MYVVSGFSRTVTVRLKNTTHNRKFLATSIQQLLALDVGKQRREDSEQREKRAQTIDVFDAVSIGQGAEHGGAEPAHAEREAKEDARDQPDAAGHQLLRVDDD